MPNCFLVRIAAFKGLLIAQAAIVRYGTRRGTFLSAALNEKGETCHFGSTG